MAWSTCEFCGKRINGAGAMDQHQRATHPAQREVKEATQILEMDQHGLAYIQQYQAQLADYRLALALPNLPEPARHLVEDRLANWPFSNPYRLPPEEYLAKEVEYYQAAIVKAQAALDALTAKEVQDAL